MTEAETKRQPKQNGARLEALGIAVDYWRVVNKPYFRYFFLTHAHSDHTDGLTSTWRHPIYCSGVTADLASHLTGVDRKTFRPLELDVVHEILDEEGNLFMNVLLIDANHCPGAVMFLFTGHFGRILCTGDFRYEIDSDNDIVRRSLNVLKEAPIDRLFLDTTNWNNLEKTIPSRRDVTQEIIERIKGLPELCRVVIAFPNVYLGRENMLTEIARALNERICVPLNRMEVLQILNCYDVFVTDRDEARILAVPLSMARIEFNRISAKHAESFLIMATSLSKQVQFDFASDVSLFAPYSDHCSRLEIEHFLSQLQTHRIVGVPNELTESEHKQFATGSSETKYEPIRLARNQPTRNCIREAVSRKRRKTSGLLNVKLEPQPSSSNELVKSALRSDFQPRIIDRVTFVSDDFTLNPAYYSILEEYRSAKSSFVIYNPKVRQDVKCFVARTMKNLLS